MSSEPIPVLIYRDRTGKTADFILDKTGHSHISEVLKSLLASDAIICTDGDKAISAAIRDTGIAHRPVNLVAGIQVISKVYHVQNVSAYDSRLKMWMHRFHGVATHYLANDLGWRWLIDHAKTPITPQAFLLTESGVSSDQQLTIT